ncbi:MAG: LptF/LptG family permease [Pseudomonadota bacterium]
MSDVRGLFTFYVGRMFAIRFIGLLLFFVIILQMLDLLNSSKDINAAEGADFTSILRYISLRAPQIASQFTPFAALLSIVTTLTALNQRSEITIMRAAGMSIHKVLFPIGFACALIATIHFLMHEFVTVQSTAKLAYWEANNYAVGLPPDDGTRTDVEFIFGEDIIKAGSAVRRGGEVVMRNIRIIQRDQNGLPDTITNASEAIHRDNNWSLINGNTLNSATFAATPFDVSAWSTTLDPELLFSVSLNPDQSSLTAIGRQIDQLEKENADTRSAMTSLLSRFSKPMSTLIMPLLGALAGFGVTRQGAQLLRAVLGASLGFAYFVFENLMLALGKLGAVPAVFGSFFPFVLFLIVGFAILLSMES